MNFERIEQIAFIILTIAATWYFIRNVRRLRRNIMLGKEIDEPIKDAGKRWKLLLLNALGQRKMFKRPIPAVLHFFVYVGFIIINVEVMEIVLDGLLGKHRLFAKTLGDAYPAFISCFEFLALAVLISCAIFLVRRNILKVHRLNMPELNRFPKVDANIILVTEIVLMAAFLTLDGADQAIQNKHFFDPPYFQTGHFYFSSMLIAPFSHFTTPHLKMIERTGWWLHIIGIFAFLNYLPMSKHLHILLSFPNTYYTRLKPSGKIQNMPEVEKEVQLMLNPGAATSEPAAEPGRFGAKDVPDLSWRDVLGAFSCTECGRCTAVCPANITGKKLSPRKIMMDTRDRAEEIGRNLDTQGKDFKDEKSLLNDYITHEEILACTSCQACVEACPVNIDPLSIIIQLRRYTIMEEAKSPTEWNGMFANIENNQAPWQFSPQDRFKWADDVQTKENLENIN
jgi:ferredoxin